MPKINIKEFIERNMKAEEEVIMNEVQKDPEVKDLQCPNSVEEQLYKQICEREESRLGY